MANNFNGSQLYAGNNSTANNVVNTNNNHIFLDTKETFSETVAQVDKVNRHKGLYITYIYKNTIYTYYYNNNEIDNKFWTNIDNWRDITNNKVIIVPPKDENNTDKPDTPVNPDDNKPTNPDDDNKDDNEDNKPPVEEIKPIYLDHSTKQDLINYFNSIGGENIKKYIGKELNVKEYTTHRGYYTLQQIVSMSDNKIATFVDYYRDDSTITPKKTFALNLSYIGPTFSKVLVNGQYQFIDRSSVCYIELILKPNTDIITDMNVLCMSKTEIRLFTPEDFTPNEKETVGYDYYYPYEEDDE